MFSLCVFSLYHKERGSLHKRPIEPLSDEEYNKHLFRLRSAPDSYGKYKQGYVIPEYEDVIHRRNKTNPTRIDVSINV